MLKLTQLTLVLTVAMSFSASAVEVAKHLTTIVEPVPVKRIEPRYPVEAARAGKSGWAKLSFVINEEGRVKDIVINEVVGHRGFGKAAKNALKKWKYTPAMEDGEPIQQCVNSVKMDFRMVGGGVTKGFRKLHKKALSAINDKDYAQLGDVIDDMSKYQYGQMAEISLYHSLAAHLAQHRGEKRQEAFHLSRIEMSFWAKSEENRKLSILNRRLILAVELNEFRQAFDVYSKLKSLDAAQPYMDKFDEIMAQVEGVISSDKNILIHGDIADKEFWFYSLVRNEFSLTDIKGSLNKLDVRCANKRHTYSVENNNTWTLPSSWKNCGLFIYGDDKTTFKLIEHPLKS